MASEHDIHDGSESRFSVGALRKAQAAQRPQAPTSAGHAPLSGSREKGGSDPYNTSGSFDRSKNWARIGKR